MELFIGIMIPFLGTCLGSASVFFMKDELKPLVQKGLLGFASGVMVAASVWSLLIPAMDMSDSMGKFAFVPAAAGFLLGIFFLLAMDRLVPHLHGRCGICRNDGGQRPDHSGRSHGFVCGDRHTEFP